MKMIRLHNILKSNTAFVLMFYCVGCTESSNSSHISQDKNETLKDSVTVIEVLDSSVYSVQLLPDYPFSQLSFDRKSAILFGLYLDSISIGGNSYGLDSKVIGVSEDSNYLTVECYIRKQTYKCNELCMHIYVIGILDHFDELYLMGGHSIVPPRAAKPFTCSAVAKFHFRKLNHKVVNKITFGNSIDTSSVQWVREDYQ